MPPAAAVRTESPTTTTTPPPAVDVTLPFDPSFVDIAHPDQPPIPPPKDHRLQTRTSSKSSSSSSSSNGKSTPVTLESARAGRPKQRSASTPVPKTSTTTSSTTATATTTTATTSNARSSSKSRHHHRATKSHSHKDDGDLIVDLVKELRAAKKRERAGSLSLSLGLGGVKSLLSGLGGGGAAGGGGAQDHEAKIAVSPVDRVHHPPFHYPRDPHSQSRSVPIPPPPPEPKQQSSVPRQQSSAEAIANAVKASLAMVDNPPTTKKKRQRSASSASALPHSHSKSSSTTSASSTTDSIVLLVQNLQHETARANAAEAQRRELLDKMRDVMKQKVELEAQLGMVKEELGLYKVQLDLAQKGWFMYAVISAFHDLTSHFSPEILKAQDVVESVDRQRVLAEREAARNRERVRRLVEDQLVQEALEAGRREGYNEGMRRGKEARKLEEENQRRLASAREQERREREERAARIAAEERRKEQERAQREKERLGRRARSNTVGTAQDAATAARTWATAPLLPVPPPRPPTAGPSNWRQVPAQPPSRPSTAGPQNWSEPPRSKESDQQRREHIPDLGQFAPLLPLPTLVTPVPLEVPATQPQPPSAINTMHPQQQQRQSSQSSSSSSSSQRLRQRPGAEDGNRHPSSTTATTRAQHGTMKGYLGHTPTAESERHPHYDRVVHPAYVPPPDNFIPAMNADGSLSVPPPHELGRRPVSMVAEEEEDDDQDEGVTDHFGESAVISTPKRAQGRTYSVGSSNFAREFEVANPEREMARMRMKMEVGDGETPTPAPSRGLPHHHQDKGKMKVTNPDFGPALVDEPRSGSRAREKSRERYGWDITVSFIVPFACVHVD
ncbi:hypothetical protein EST38_g2676 [Candolleomyces aberdarensis]|uniref:Uncharacterized protein n=1 Tax=Candolleomyces aberdarensis TaxID=2316362 RepID=A0A4Q2DSD1_9AGAR|nr:hypothetical protein EST38_g2676 [Candolleomyces aberdarensis]